MLGGLLGIYAIMLRPPSRSAKQRRRALGISGNRRDKDPIGTSILVAVAVADLTSTAEGVGLGSAIFLGLALAAILSVAAARPLVYTAVGAMALLSAVRDLTWSSGCGDALTPGQRAGVFFATATFLLAVGMSRLLVAPLRATGAEGRGALLAVYGVLQGSVYALQLQAAGGFDGWPLGGYAAGALCLLVLAFATSVRPVLATSTLGVTLVVLALTTDTAANCLDIVSIIGVLIGFFGLGIAVNAMRRRTTRRADR